MQTPWWVQGRARTRPSTCWGTPDKDHAAPSLSKLLARAGGSPPGNVHHYHQHRLVDQHQIEHTYCSGPCWGHWDTWRHVPSRGGVCDHIISSTRSEILEKYSSLIVPWIIESWRDWSTCLLKLWHPPLSFGVVTFGVGAQDGHFCKQPLESWNVKWGWSVRDTFELVLVVQKQLCRKTGVERKIISA